MPVEQRTTIARMVETIEYLDKALEQALIEKKQLESQLALQKELNISTQEDRAERCSVTIEKAVELLKAEYERAEKLEYIRNPLAWALYKVWKQADAEKKQE